MFRIAGVATSFFASLLLIGGAINGQETRPTKELISAIDRFIKSLEVDEMEPGLAILVREPGQLEFKKAYGLANLKTGERISSRTLFELASLSKPFTATAVLMLVERNKLTLDQDVRSILPELPAYRKDRPILVRHLLSHTSGLPEYFDFEVEPTRNKSYVDNADYLPIFARLKADYPQEFKAGSTYRYCNSNYLLLALIVERVSGKAFSEFMKEEIFIPLKMNDSFIHASPNSIPANSKLGPNRAVGYEWSKKKMKWLSTWGTPNDSNEYGLIVGDGSIWSNIEDLMKWDDAVRSRKLLKPNTWKLALTPALTSKSKPLDYGLGWQLDYEDSTKINGFGHDGSWAGFHTIYYYSNVTGRTTVLLCNRSDLDVDAIWTELERIFEQHQMK